MRFAPRPWGTHRRRYQSSRLLGTIVGQFKARGIQAGEGKRHRWRHKDLARGYHDHVVRDERSLNEIRRYILNWEQQQVAGRLYVNDRRARLDFILLV